MTFEQRFAARALHDMLLGKQFGPYLVEKELGSGAMGAVYRARDKESGERVAIKIVNPALAASSGALARFKREIFILKQLEHPNIVRLIRSGKISGSPFYVMEYVEGESLDHVIERRNRITWEELIPIGKQLCAALQYAHEKGIIHRDLKPSNVMVLKDGTVKLADFGIAQDIDATALTAANSTVGTAAYMSPEQCQGTKNLTFKSDLYSLGVMFYELVTGRKPFTADSIMDMFNKHLEGKFIRPAQIIPELPIKLDNLIRQMMEKETDTRPFNADIISQTLDRIQEASERQESAAVDAATKKRMDRTGLETPLDETDKEAARTLLGKKKKKKKVAFYRQGWFTVLAVALIAAGLGVVVWWAFIKAPSAQSLYEATAAVMKESNPDRASLKDARGNIEKFFDLYKDDAEAKALRGEMQTWADKIDREANEHAMHKRRDSKWAIDPKAPDAKEEERAREALDYEDLGRLKDAAEIWSELLRHKETLNRDLRPWGLVAEDHLRHLKDVDVLLRELEAKVAAEEMGKPAAPENKYERLALEALRKNQPPQALNAWNDLKTQAQDPAQRRWYLLAARMHREWTEKQK